MKELKRMKETLTSMVEGQLNSGNIGNIDAKELGEVVDMIKDLAETIYYCSITEAMEKNSKEEERPRDREYHYYTDYRRPMMYYTDYTMPMDYNYMPRYYWDRDMDREYGRMYYTDGMSSGSNGMNSSNSGNMNSSNGGNNARGGGTRGYFDPRNMPMLERDYREGRSPSSRRSYMESKETNQSKEVQMKELDKYIHELSDDITEMIQTASPEEKSMLQQKISTLATKIK